MKKKALKNGKKIVLAYSGGLDTSVIIRWLIENYHCEVIAFIADLGQRDDNLNAVKKKALNTGATKAIVRDLRETFVRDYVFSMLRGNATYEGGYLLGTSIARPLIAKEQIAVAEQEKALAVSHGATGKGNDQVRFELAYHALAPRVQVIAPWREWDFRSRSDLVRYAQRHNIPVPVTKAKPYSSDANLFHISYEGGVLEDPWTPAPRNMFQMTVDPEKAPHRSQEITLDYKQGNPVALNGKTGSPFKLLSRLNKIAGAHGIGRIDLVENRYVGMKSRGVYETPGGTVLHVAHRALESITMDREVMHLRDTLIPRYAEMIYYGYWFSPERRLLQSFMDESQKNVTGRVRLKLYKGNCLVVGRKAKKSLYSPDLATFEKDEIYNQKDAEGFINLFGLPIKVQAKLK